jgi:hypothetical protein
MRLKKIGIAAILAAGIAAPAFAGTLEAMLANTVTATDGEGATNTLLFNEDGTLTSTAPDGIVSEGSWKDEGGELCTTINGAGPDGADATSCGALAEGKGVGDTWEATIEAGEEPQTLTVTIVEGR